MLWDCCWLPDFVQSLQTDTFFLVEVLQSSPGEPKMYGHSTQNRIRLRPSVGFFLQGLFGTLWLRPATVGASIITNIMVPYST